MIAVICASIPESDDRIFMLEVYEKYKRLMFYMAKRSCSELSVCEDIVQESVLRLISKLALLKQLDERALVSYIAVTVRNTSYTHIRRENKEKELFLSLDDMWQDIPDKRDSMENIFIQTEEILNLYAVWPQLSDRERLLLEGKYLLGNSDYEIADLVGCSASSVRMMLTRARRRALKLMLNKEGAHETNKTT